MDQTKAQRALAFAKELEMRALCATDFHNAFFGIGGTLGRIFPTREEREEFAATPEYQAIVRIRAELRQNERAVP